MIIGHDKEGNRRFIIPTLSDWGRFALVLIAFLAAIILVSTATAQSNQPGDITPDEVNRVARLLYCPVCPNTPLDVCETQACKDWRELIRQKLASGASDQEIIDYFVAQYGPRVLAQPPAKGFYLLMWIIPLVVLIAGAAALVVILRRWSGLARRPTSVSAPVPQSNELPAEYVARVERELQARR